jgi:ring-1,2-phenylacetyl-CoA epoxidase subunit PaaD
VVIAPAKHACNNVEDVWQVLHDVKDPEIPVLSVVNLGIVRAVELKGDDLEVVITPTYSGCPAMNMIEADVRETLKRCGFPDAKVTTVLSPAWTTDWITEEGRDKLRAYGIAPPEQASGSKLALFGVQPDIACPRCSSTATEMVSEFGSTACKALYRCNSCLEPFDYFKCI